MRKSLPVLLAMLLTLAFSAAANAHNPPIGQVLTGTITGTVTDPQGAVIAGADVHATHNQTGEAFTDKSKDDGSFALSGLPFGDYSVLIACPGFADFRMQVTLSTYRVASPHNSTFQLAIGELRVDAQMTLDGSTGLVCIVCNYTYFSLPFADLPLRDRDPQRLLMIQPGVTEHEASFSIAGRRLENKTALLDGFDDRDSANGQFIASLPIDFLEFNTEFTNADTSISSSYGQNSAPLLAAFGKSGTNQYHGQGFWYLERTGFSANNFFTNRGGLVSDQSMFDLAGFTLGGNLSLPRVVNGKDHAFFFVSYEHTRDRETTGRQIVAPLASFVDRTAAIQGPLFQSLLSRDRIPLSAGRSGGLQDVDGDGLSDVGDTSVRSSFSLTRNLTVARIDLMLTKQLHLNFRYYGDQSRRLDDFSELAFTPASPLDASHKGQLGGLQLTALINPATINDFRIGYRRGLALLSGAGSDAPQVVALNSPLNVASGPPELPEDRESRAWILADTLSRVAGAHSVSLGAQVIRRDERLASQGLAQGRIYYADMLAMATDGMRSAGDPNRSIVRAELVQSFEPESYRFSDFYAFAHDDWRAGPRFVLNFGAAYNIYSGAIYGRSTDKNNIAPFASFAFAPTHSENIILRGGAAMFYVPPTLLPYGEIKATPLYPIASGFAQAFEIAGSPLPRAWTGQAGAVEIEQEFSRNLRTAYTESAFFAIQYSIRDRLIVEAGYHSTFGHRLTRAYQKGRALLDGTQRTSETVNGGSATELPILIASDGNSSYHSMQVSVTSRERRRLIFQAHYTYSKSIDTASVDRPSMFRSLALGPVNENSADLERGVSDFDRRHRGAGIFQWRGPSMDGSSTRWRWVLSDWLLTGIVIIQSGPMLSVYSSGDLFGGNGDFNRDGVLNDRPSYAGARTQNPLRNGSSPADGYFNRNQFAAPGVNGREPLGRNVLSAPGYGSVDLSLRKRFSLTDEHRIEVRADVFNIENRVNFAAPVTDFVSTDFGRAIDATSPRTVRLALRYLF